ncbi:hypothetical protein BJ165DRAFT_1408034 [Panaeolus papilionaceus]|nr:hypothetical protein BJ165DRAFT_1408034 [Panaeolus papilionaceus]
MSLGTSEQHGDRVFPLEIFEKILKAIPHSNRYSDMIGWEHQTIQSCSLVCKDFVRLARPFLFYKAYVGAYHSGPGRGIHHRMSDILVENPYVRTYVQELSYLCPMRIPGSEVEPEEDLSVFLKLPCLKRLDVNCRSLDRTTYQNSAPDAFGYRQLLETYLPMGQLTTVSIFGCEGLPIAIVLASSGLKNLKLTACNLSLEGMKLDGSHLAAHRLTRLIMDEVSNVPLSTLFSPRSCSELKSLDIHSIEAAEEPAFVWHLATDGAFGKLKDLKIDGQGAWRKLIDAALLGGGVSQIFPAVKRLKIRPGVSRTDPQPDDWYSDLFRQCLFPRLEEVNVKGSQYSFDIYDLELDLCLEQCKSTVKRISITWDLYTVSVSNAEFVVWAIIPILENIPSDNVLETIELVIQPWLKCDWDAEGAEGDEEEIHDPNFEGWQALEELLLESPTRFPRLRSVAISVQFKPRFELDNNLEKHISQRPQIDRLSWFAGLPMRKLRAATDLSVKCEFWVEVLNLREGLSIRLKPETNSFSFTNTKFWSSSDSEDDPDFD